MGETSRSRMALAVALMAGSSVAVELSLTRIFDVTLSPGLSYLMVSVAILGFGLAGFWRAARPGVAGRDLLARTALGYAAAVSLILPAMAVLPLNPYLPAIPLFMRLGAFLALYAFLLAPFFLAGLFLISIFSENATRIGRLYGCDLLGAGVASLAVLPLIPLVGATGLLLWGGAAGALTAVLCTRSRALRAAAVVFALVLVAVPLSRRPGYIQVTHHINKRGVMNDARDGRRELTVWDPISLIYVVDHPRFAGPALSHTKGLQYDGGNQSSFMFPFDGDLAAQRRKLETQPDRAREDFWQLGVLAAHFLKRDSGQSVAILGSAGGQETRAALLYGARQVDCFEMVSAVVDLVKGRYSSYLGGVFQRPEVRLIASEGRSALASSGKRYDIIQIFSNHTSSSVAQGNGALSPVYLQTVEAYRCYFQHLTAGGVLQVNHYFYPRVITTAAAAWAAEGRSDFIQHALVFSTTAQPSLPTILIKMEPWTPAEVHELEAFLRVGGANPFGFTLVEDPCDSARHFLSPDFFSGKVSEPPRSPMLVSACSDDHPFFNFFRKSFEEVKTGPLVTPDMAWFAEHQLQNGVPVDVAHLIIATVVLALLTLGVLVASLRGEGRPGLPLLGYFACLGAGFLIVESVLIQRMMVLVGSPLHTFATVISALLVGAGAGSFLSARLKWRWPFLAILGYGLALDLGLQTIIDAGLACDLSVRVGITFVLLAPLGFFLGMPFPKGMLELESPRAMAWAWGVNSLFTVVGELAAALLSLAFGFTATLGVGLGVYAVAMLIFPRLGVS